MNKRSCRRNNCACSRTRKSSHVASRNKRNGRSKLRPSKCTRRRHVNSKNKSRCVGSRRWPISSKRNKHKHKHRPSGSSSSRKSSHIASRNKRNGRSKLRPSKCNRRRHINSKNKSRCVGSRRRPISSKRNKYSRPKLVPSNNSNSRRNNNNNNNNNSKLKLKLKLKLSSNAARKSSRHAPQGDYRVGAPTTRIARH